MAFNAESQKVYDAMQRALHQYETFQAEMDAAEAGSDLYKSFETKRDKAWGEYSKLKDSYESRERMEQAEGDMNSRFHKENIQRHRPAADPHIQLDPEKPTEESDINLRYKSVFLRNIQIRAKAHTGFMEAIEYEKQQQPTIRAYHERNLGVTSTTAIGAHIVPTDMIADINVRMRYHGPLWDENVTGSLNTERGNDIIYPTINDTTQPAAHIAEGTTRGVGDDPVFGSVTFKSYKYGTKVIKITEELIRDSIVALEGVLIRVLGTRMGRVMNGILTNGSDGETTGIAADATNFAALAANNAITADEVLGLLHSVNPAYRIGPRVYFEFNDSLLRRLRGLRFGQTGDTRPIWSMGDIRAGEPATIWGMPYLINPDLGNLGADDNIVMLFGNHDEYIVRRTGQMQISFNDQLYWEEDEIGVKATVHADAKLMVPTAIRALPTS